MTTLCLVILMMVAMVAIVVAPAFAAEKTKAPEKPSLTSVKSEAVKKITVTWKPVKKADGYQIRYTTGDTKKTATVQTDAKAGTDKLKTTISNLPGGAEYKVKIRSYRKTDEEGSDEGSVKIVTSGWTKAKTVTVKHTKWSDLQDKYLEKEKVKQIVFVKYKGGSEATLVLYKKVSVANETADAKKGSSDKGSAAENESEKTKKDDADSDGKDADADSDTEDKSEDAGSTKKGSDKNTESNSSIKTYKWEKVLSCKAYVGMNGIDKKKEGDRRTPTGVYTLNKAFGVKKDPGSKMKYKKLNKHLYWCGDKEHYNQMIDIRDHPHSCRGEHLIEYTKQYAYAMAMDYNKDCTYGKGSAIFLHCFGYDSCTLGCVAVSEDNMKTILKTCGKNAKICIYKK